MLIQVSYPLEKLSPLYPGSPEVSFNPVKSIANKDSSNTSMLSFGSHSGTHIDAPLHFCDNGFSIIDVLKAENIFSPAVCIDISKEINSYIDRTDLEPYALQISNAEVLLIRTGFFKYRNDKQDLYTTSHPWVHPSVPEYLHEICPQLKLFGIDAISISNPSHRDEGRAAHKAFLCDEKPILLLEDANLSDSRLLDREFKLQIYPWIVDELESTPVTALAVLDDVL